MADSGFAALALRDHMKDVAAVETGAAVDTIELEEEEEAAGATHFSLDVASDLKRASEPSAEPVGPKAAAVTAVLDGVKRMREPAAPSSKKAGRTSSEFLQTRKKNHSSPGKRQHRIWHATLLTVYVLTTLACWGAVSPAWVRLRENVVTPIGVDDPTDDPNMKFHNTYKSVGGLMVVINYLSLVRLVSGVIYFATCLLPATCGGRLLPWNWHNEEVFLNNHAQQCNPTYWIWLAWASSVGCAETGILLQIHDEWLLVATAVLAASSVYIIQFTELENAGSPNESKDQRAFWLAFVPWIVKYIILWRGYRLASTATMANGQDFHFPEWIYFSALLYLLPELLHLMMVAMRLWKCCGMESYASFARQLLCVTAVSQLCMAAVVSAGLHYL